MTSRSLEPSMTKIVPRLVCERFPRYVIVEREDRRQVRYWTGNNWSLRLQDARLYAQNQDVESVINRLQSSTYRDQQEDRRG